MSFHTTPSSERIHIGIFGKRNAGKSSLINALTSQDLAIVSPVKGTTTDPVLKSMELLPLGPVVLIDTPGLDDEGDLGALRIQKTYQMLRKTDLAVLVTDPADGITEEDRQILQRILQKQIPYLVVCNKADLFDSPCFPPEADKEHCIFVSAKTGAGIEELKERLARQIPASPAQKPIAADLVHPLDFVILVVPIDGSAPKGRLILPQQQTIRDLLKKGAVPVVVRDTELSETLEKLGRPPALVITDSQAFARVSALVPKEIPLTSFSILFARYKGNLKQAVLGARTLDLLQEKDRILISEGCTHHRQCEDIGTVKLPGWIRKYTGKEFHFQFTSGTEFPEDLHSYRLIIHCGGCMLNEQEMRHRLECAKEQNVPMTNYGTAIAHMHGILDRSIEIFHGFL
ncbi:MAG: [FeFe] hydrogenase H-cluster maturation GTPase HydF [Ruminococcus sp.]|nr:[FeFe] hydrogenase H-cluster maturation GTPase HydF [Ruminococcus sp.]